MKEIQETQAASEGPPPSTRVEDKPVKDAMRQHGPAIALATALLASYALVLNSISDLRADFRAGMMDLRQEFRTEFERVDVRFERIDARFERIDDRFERIDGRLYELIERVARIEGHLALTQAPAAEKNSLLDEHLETL